MIRNALLFFGALVTIVLIAALLGPTICKILSVVASTFSAL
jgi:hypothetical protein